MLQSSIEICWQICLLHIDFSYFFTKLTLKLHNRYASSSGPTSVAYLLCQAHRLHILKYRFFCITAFELTFKIWVSEFLQNGRHCKWASEWLRNTTTSLLLPQRSKNPTTQYLKPVPLSVVHQMQYLIVILYSQSPEHHAGNQIHVCQKILFGETLF